jgi:hypothetical protein
MTLAAEADDSLLSEDRIVVAPAAYRELPSVVAAQQTMPCRRFMIDATVDIAWRLRERLCLETGSAAGCLPSCRR